ncbi:probable E3 ubiquitin-protein ligase XERICO [Prosopis cineraria]|uniref:probable E3 ubiquitin-protein ligase XERICO n=1 Tax=Prosopis cineraria TaxID=364024 RepID=UPI00240F4E6E|nr:probable E3 ubiquitin-protein ligase XERICO [Prosopis cineraria]
MGLSSLPAPSEGVLCVLLVNTAFSISLVKGIVRTILHIVGISLSSSPTTPPSQSSSESSPSPDISQDLPESFQSNLCSPENYIDEFTRRTPTIKFGSVCGCKQPEEHDCSVCLTEFEPESEINRLSCGHLFHKDCLEKWLAYWNITCPLCRTPLLPEEEVSSCFW